VKAIQRVSNAKFIIHTAQGAYLADNVVYTGTFKALQNIDIPTDVIPKRVQRHIKTAKYMNALKVIWTVDEPSETTLRAIFGSHRQLHVPQLPWTVMLHEKSGYLYTFAVGPSYDEIKETRMSKLRADLMKVLNINIVGQSYIDFNKNKYFEASYASLLSSSPKVYEKLANPSDGFYMCGDGIIAPSMINRMESCIGTVTGAIQSSHYISSLIINNS
jgi:hypothetical protein